MAVSGVARWHVGGVKEASFESSSESVQCDRIVDGSRYIVPGSWCRDQINLQVEK